MPLVANTKLPAFDRLREEGGTVISSNVALHQDIRELHIGLLNMMPDAALTATERQFFRLIGESNQIAQFYVHPFTIKEIERGPKGASHIEQFYESFDEIKAAGLDALIITGANVTQPDLALEPFWQPLIEVIDWAYENVTSTLCSCLATHAVMQFRYGQKRQRLPENVGVSTRTGLWIVNTPWSMASTHASMCPTPALTKSAVSNSKQQAYRCWQKVMMPMPISQSARMAFDWSFSRAIRNMTPSAC